jgi:hypothetical protein
MQDVITTTGRMRRLVEFWVGKLKTVGPFDGATYENGIDGLRDVLLGSLDTGEFGDPDQRDVLDDTRKFCTSHCPEAENGGPGRALRCTTCPLKYHALTRYEETLEEIANEAVESRRETT